MSMKMMEKINFNDTPKTSSLNFYGKTVQSDKKLTNIKQLIQKQNLMKNTKNQRISLN